MPLLSSKELVLGVMEKNGLREDPQPLARLRSKRNPKLYCKYHRDIGHDTENCRHLARATERLMKGIICNNFMT